MWLYRWRKRRPIKLFLKCNANVDTRDTSARGCKNENKQLLRSVCPVPWRRSHCYCYALSTWISTKHNKLCALLSNTFTVKEEPRTKFLIFILFFYHSFFFCSLFFFLSPQDDAFSFVLGLRFKQYISYWRFDMHEESYVYGDFWRCSTFR